jgi:hypothetical protein
VTQGTIQFGQSLRLTVQDAKQNVIRKEKSAAVFAVRRANYTHRRKGVFNAQSIEHLQKGINVRNRTKMFSQGTPKNDKPYYLS